MNSLDFKKYESEELFEVGDDMVWTIRGNLSDEHSMSHVILILKLVIWISVILKPALHSITFIDVINENWNPKRISYGQDVSG